MKQKSSMSQTHEIKDYLKNNYVLGRIQKIRLLNYDNINSKNYLLTTLNKKFVLRNFLDNSNPTKIEKICMILNFCNKKGAKVCAPVKRKLNNYVDKTAKN